MGTPRAALLSNDFIIYRAASLSGFLCCELILRIMPLFVVASNSFFSIGLQTLSCLAG